MKKSLILKVFSLFTAAAILLQAAGCGSGAAQSSAPESAGSQAEGTGGEFVFGLQTQPDHLDPYLAATADTRQILFNVFEGLVKPDKDGNLKPALAESWTMADGALSYTFRLRKGVKFHNGKTVTPEDVKYSLEKAAGLSGGEVLVSSLSNVKSVETSGEDEVRIALKKPDYDFLPNLTVAVVPKDYEDQDTRPVGTGPYQFESFTPQQSLVLVKNTDYWQKGVPYLDKVTFKLESDSNALLMDLQGGSVDGAAVANNIASQLGGGFDVVQANSNSVQLLALNNAAKPFDNKLVRQAVSYAVDPDEIIRTVELGKGVRVGTPVIPGLKKYCDESLTHAYDRNVEKAKQLLAQAGYANGFSFTITVPSNYTVHVDTAQVIAGELKEAGITAQIKQVDFATWLSRAYTDRDYEATIVSVDGATLSPKSYLGRYVSTDSKNFVNYKSSRYDELYAKAENEPDEAQRTALYKQAQELLSQDAASVYLQDISNLIALKSGITGYTAYPLYVFDAASIHNGN